MNGIYVRVSAKDQKLAGQEAELKRWLEAHTIPEASVRWYRDKETGKTLERPAFEQLQKDIFDGTIKTVVVWKLDRISRSLRDGINTLADWCERGLRVVSVTQQLDLSGPVGRLVAAVLFGLAEVELEYRRERQAMGIEVARAQGAYKGRKPGSTKGKPARARQLQRQGLTSPEIAAALGVSQRTVWRYLNASAAQS